MTDENYRLVKHDSEDSNKIIFTNPITEELLHKAEIAIELGIEPSIIPQGSSGSYFVRDQTKTVIAVFKPKDEEPYELLNPKWGKYFHRLCCPCCFGRQCLLSNNGYLSEVGASIIDEALDLNIVPPTRLSSLTSTSFNHGPINIIKSKTKTQIAEKFPDIGRKFHRLGVPPKIGSLQLFVEGYTSADLSIDNLLMSLTDKNLSNYRDFLFQFQKLVVLDYIIRNTDRNNTNWLIKLPLESKEDKEDINSSDIIKDNHGFDDFVKENMIKIAAIDNGLAFPYKHPDQMRMYPYYWTWLSLANEPFSDEICELILPKLAAPHFVEKMIEDLYILFKISDHFKKSIFEKQMSVMRGQITNLCAALRQRKSPVQLVEMAPMTLELIPSSLEDLLANPELFNRSSSTETSEKKKRIFNYVTKYWKRPFFRKF